MRKLVVTVSRTGQHKTYKAGEVASVSLVLISRCI